MGNSKTIKKTVGLTTRIRQVREVLLISRSELARRVGVQPSAAIQWEREKGTHPSTAHLIRIASMANVSFDWLATGRGHARLPSETLAAEAIALDLFEETLLKLGRGIPFDSRDAVIGILAALNKS